MENKIGSKIKSSFKIHTGFDVHLDQIASKTNFLGENLEKAFRGHTWCELTTNQVWGFYSDFPCFTHVAFRYYLPGIMTVSLNSFDDEVDSMACDIIEHLVWHLSPSKRDAMLTDWWLERMSDFTREQIECIVLFIEHATWSVFGCDESSEEGWDIGLIALEYWKQRSCVDLN